MEQGTAFLIRGVGFVAGGALLWWTYFNLKDRLKPEPRRLLVFAFVLGMAAAVLALAVYRIAGWLGLPQDPGMGPGSIIAYCLAVVGPIEEGAKFLVVRAVVFRWRAFDEPIDGLVYAAMVAVGFASIENVLYLEFLTWPAQMARSLTTPLTHSLFAVVWGYGLTRARFTHLTATGRIAWQAGTLLLAMLLHGLYDAFLLAFQAPFLSAGLSLVLWIAMIVQARKLVHAVHL